GVGVEKVILITPRQVTLEKAMRFPLSRCKRPQSRRPTRLHCLRLEDRTVPASFQALGSLVGANGGSFPLHISSNGSVVVGDSVKVPVNGGAFRWTAATGMVPLGSLSGDIHSVAKGVSGDGSVVVGYCEDAAYNARAFRWTQSTGMIDIGALPGTTEALA